LGRARNAYLESWSCLEQNLYERLGKKGTIVSFGTGGWSANLAGYAPAVWERIQACTVDKPVTTTYLNKPVIQYSSLHEWSPDVVLVAVNPGRQDSICQRLRRDGYHAVCWNDLIAR
jgi:hypothetical protein